MAFYRHIADIGSIVLICTGSLLGLVGVLLVSRPSDAWGIRGADFLCDLGCGIVLSCGWGLSAMLIECINVGILAVTTGGVSVMYPLLTAPFVFAGLLSSTIPDLFTRPYHHVRRAFLSPPVQPDSRYMYRPRIRRTDLVGLAVLWALVGASTSISQFRQVTVPFLLTYSAIGMYVPLRGFLYWEVGLNFTRYQRWYGVSLLAVVCLAVAGIFGLRALPL